MAQLLNSSQIGGNEDVCASVGLVVPDAHAEASTLKKTLHLNARTLAGPRRHPMSARINHPRGPCLHVPDQTQAISMPSEVCRANARTIKAPFDRVERGFDGSRVGRVVWFGLTPQSMSPSLRKSTTFVYCHTHPCSPPKATDAIPFRPNRRPPGGESSPAADLRQHTPIHRHAGYDRGDVDGTASRGWAIHWVPFTPCVVNCRQAPTS